MKSRNAKLYRATGGITLAVLATAVSARGATVSWGGNGNSDNSGTWETQTNWVGNLLPTNTSNANLVNVTTGTRIITISNGFPETINQLTMTQTTAGAVNQLDVDDNLTITGTSTALPAFVFNASAGQSSIVTNIAAGKTLSVGTNLNVSTGCSFGGTLNLAAGSAFQLVTTGASSDILGPVTFAGPINATGAGAQMLFQPGRFDPSSMTFGGALTTSGAGTTMTLQVNGNSGAAGSTAMTFNGNDGSGNSLNVAAGTQFNAVLAGGSTLNFTNAVNLAAASGPNAGAIVSIGATPGSQNSTSNFSGGLIIGAGASLTDSFIGSVVNLFNTSSVASGGTLIVQYTSTQGAGSLVNNGNFTVDGGAIKIDYAAVSNNNGAPRSFTNAAPATWTLKNNASLAFVSSTGRALQGFGVGANNNNFGMMNVQSGSSVGFDTLYNAGILNLGSSTGGVSDATVNLGSPINSDTNVTLSNGNTSTGTATAATLNFKGNAYFGRTNVSTGSLTTLNNGSNSSTGSIINVGDGIVPVLVTLANSGTTAVFVNNYAGNTLNIKPNGTLLLKALATSAVATGGVTFTNGGTLVQAGTLELQTNFNGVPSVTSAAGSVYQISGTSAGWTELPAQASGLNVARPSFSVAGTLSGASASDTLTYTNSTGNAADNILPITVTGSISPGNGSLGVGTLGFVNANSSGGTYAMQLAAPGTTPALGVSDRVALSGTGGNLNISTSSLALSDNANLNAQGSAGAGSYRLLTYTGALTGTFATVTNPLSATLHEKVLYTGAGTVDLNLYRLANPAVTPTITLPIVHPNGTFSTSVITIQNNAANDGFSEGLNASFGTLNGVSTNGGSITNLPGGSSDTASMTVNLTGSTANPGLVTGTAAVTLASNGSATSGYGNTPLATQNFTLNGQVNDFAQPQFTFNVGSGIVSSSDATHFKLDLGSVPQGSGTLTSALNLFNNLLSIYQDNLSGSAFSLSGSGFTLNGNSNFSAVVPGGSHGVGVSFDSSQAVNTYTETMTFTPSSDNTSSNTPLSPISLELDANLIVYTPLNLFFTGTAGVSWDLNTTANFSGGGGTVVFHNGDKVTFDGTTGSGGHNVGQFTITTDSFLSPGSTTVTGSSTYTFNGSGGIRGNGGLTKLGIGSLTLNNTNSYSGPTNISGGTVTLGGVNALPSGTNLSVNGSGTSLVASSTGMAYALQVGTLNVSGGTIDLMNNALIVHSGLLAAVNTLVANGFNNGAWNGSSGIISSAAQAAHLTALGVIENSVDGTRFGAVLHSTFENQASTDTDVLVKYTYYGDANLDGSVDASDYSRIDSSSLAEKSGPAKSGWFNGDFNYDNVVNGSDYTLIDNAFNSQGAQIASAIAVPTAELAGGTTSVPEPALGLLGIGAIGLLGRKRRRPNSLAGA